MEKEQSKIHGLRYRTDRKLKEIMFVWREVKMVPIKLEERLISYLLVENRSNCKCNSKYRADMTRLASKCDPDGKLSCHCMVCSCSDSF